MNLSKRSLTALLLGSAGLGFFLGHGFPGSYFGTALAQSTSWVEQALEDVAVTISPAGTPLWSNANSDARYLATTWSHDKWQSVAVNHPASLEVGGTPNILEEVGLAQQVNRGIVYRLEPVLIWDNELGLHPCDNGPVECEWFPLPPRPLPQRMSTITVSPQMP